MVVDTRRKKASDCSLLEKKENVKKKDETMKTDDMKLEDKEERKEKEIEKRRKKKDKMPNEVRQRKPLHYVESTEEEINEGANIKINFKVTKPNTDSLIIKSLKILVGVMFISVVLLVFLSPVGAKILSSFTADAANPSKTDSFKENIKSLEELFPTQSQYLWKVIGSASLDFVEFENPKRPAVILLAGGPEAHQTLDALASNLPVSYNNNERTVSVTAIDGRQYSDKDPNTAKKLIDDTLKNGFNARSQVAIIHHLESIPAEASMIFHSYCENDNAPFKRVVIIFTVHMTEELNPKDNVKLNQKKVEKHLENQWKDSVDKDHIEAMFSRVATATAFVTP